MRNADLAHAANEWADGLTSALQWLRNVRDGISTADEAIASVESSIAHAREVDRAAGFADEHDETVAALRETAAVCEQILANRVLVQISGPLAQARAALAKAGVQ